MVEILLGFITIVGGLTMVFLVLSWLVDKRIINREITVVVIVLLGALAAYYLGVGNL